MEDHGRRRADGLPVGAQRIPDRLGGFVGESEVALGDGGSERVDFGYRHRRVALTATDMSKLKVIAV